MTIYIFPVAVALLGILIYALASNPKLVEVGRIMFFCGLLAACLVVRGISIALPR